MESHCVQKSLAERGGTPPLTKKIHSVVFESVPNIVIIITPLKYLAWPLLNIQDGIKIIDYAIVIKSSRLSSSPAFQCSPLRLPVVYIQDGRWTRGDITQLLLQVSLI